MTTYPGTLTRVLLVFAACKAVIADRPMLVEDAHGYILGWTANISCVIMSAHHVTDRDVLFWMLDGKPLQSQGSQITQADKVFVYSLHLSLPVTANLNGKIITCQSLLNPKKKQMVQQTIHVIKLVEKPVLTGPSKVIAGLRYSWYCVADGANRAVPTIEWFFGNGTNISHGYDSEDNSYNDKDELLTYNTSSKLTLIPSEADSTFSLYCQVKETDAEPGKVSKTVNIQVITCLKGKTFVEEGVDASKYDHIVTNGFYEFELSDLEVEEPDHEATRTVPVKVLRRCSSASKDVVTWEASNNAGEDLEDSRGEINFAAGDTSAPLNLIIRNDDVPELDETISFWLTKAEKGTITSDPEKATISVKILANDDPYGYFVLTGPTSITDPKQADTSISRNGGAFGEVEVYYQATPPVHVSREPDETETNTTGFGRVVFAENIRVWHLPLPLDEYKNITVTLLEARLISSPQTRPVHNSPRLGTTKESQMTVVLTEEENHVKNETINDHGTENHEATMKPNDTDKEQTIGVAGFTDYQARPLSTSDILHVILPSLIVIMIIMIISMCCCCAFCGIIRKSCRAGDDKKCSCCGRVWCLCTPIYGVIDEENAELTKSEN